MREQFRRARWKFRRFHTAGHQLLVVYGLNISGADCRKDTEKFCIVLTILLGEITREKTELVPDARRVREFGVAIPRDRRQLEEVAHENDRESAKRMINAPHLAADLIRHLEGNSREHRYFLDDKYLRLLNPSRDVFLTRNAIDVSSRERFANTDAAPGV